MITLIKQITEGGIRPLILLTTVISLQAGAQTEATTRLVTLGGSVTEIVYALGAQDLLVGTDQSSLYPPQAQNLPSVGYYRRLPAEGVASLKPTLVIASENAGPPQVIDQLRGLNIDVLLVSDQPSEASLQERIRQIAARLDKQSEGESAIKQFQQAMQQASPDQLIPQSAMMVVMRGGKLLGAGGDTTANVVITKAGLRNALSKQRSYQQLSAEAVSALAPDVLIVTASTIKSLGGVEQFKAQPAVATASAIGRDRIVVIDDLLVMGFGLRLPQAIQQIQQGVTGEAKQ